MQRRPAAFAVALAAFALAAPSAVGVKVRRLRGGGAAPGTIQEVVNLLQEMLDNSKKEGDTDHDNYAKFKCYCDDNEKKYTQSVKELTKQIGLLENEVAGLQADNGQLSVESAKLKADMDANVQARDTANALRTEENTAFVAEEADLTAAIDQLGKAIDVLAAIGADQTGPSASHTEFMAGYDKKEVLITKLRKSVKQALLAAGSFVDPAHRRKLEAFIEVPISGAYASQAGGVVGILRSMKETFETNLASAKDTETKAQKAHDDFIATKTSEYDTMQGSYDKKQSTMGNNDGDLATKKTALNDAKDQLTADQAFLVSLEDSCSKKAKEFDARRLMRVNEEAAITEAIALLNSDHAFHTFDKVDATSTGATGFVQLRSVRRRVQATGAAGRDAARRVLRDAAAAGKDARIARIAGLLALGHPFTVVLEEIDKIKALLDKEAAQDLEQKNWCTTEQTEGNANLDSKKTQITGLEGEIEGIEDAIDNPDTGIKKLIADDETKLEDNAKSQKDQTEARRVENKAYQEDVSNCMSAASLLQKAITVLDHYYKKMEEKLTEELGFAQEDPAASAPETWADGSYEGQKTKGNDVIGMLNFILSETEKEATTAHETELSAQHAYEDAMKALKDEEELTQDSLAKNKEELAKKLQELEAARADLEKTEDEKRAIERYLERIKPGCDWITTNYDAREANRATEKAALDKAISLLKGTPAFAAAEAKEKEMLQGECKSKCAGDETHVDCLACLNKVSVPGYCAGHPGTPGC